MPLYAIDEYWAGRRLDFGVFRDAERYIHFPLPLLLKRDHFAGLRPLGEALAELGRPLTDAELSVVARSWEREPFGRAAVVVLAAFVEDRRIHASHRPNAFEVAAVRECCVAWERMRSQVAPGMRSMTATKRTMCGWAAELAWEEHVGGRLGPIDALYQHYERARAAT